MQPGELLALDVAPSRWAVLRVLAEERGDLCVVMTRWSGPSRTPLEALRRAPTLFELQPLSHHKWARPAVGGWLKPPPPASLSQLGKVPLRAGEAAQVLHPSAWVNAPRKTAALAARVLPVMRWDELIDQARKQWRWEHDRPALLREEAAAQVERVAALQQAMARHAEAEQAQEAAGLDGLVRFRFFPAWKAEKPAALHRAAEKLLRDAVTELRALPPRSAPKRLRAVMAGFNALHARYDFDSADAEDIVEAVDRVARAAKLGPAQRDVLDALRDF